ncbi:extracellular solute-binding protein [Haloarcula laminariae]|uniref:extracellular solute-binding protein n=1 Tax=Haloarcula laminariae TaxID=2961577 RepID=UPI0024061DDA|nr:extracellular solute-binding protein [Halomicroarcula sp. FL173]
MASSATAWSWDVAAKALDTVDEPYEEEHGGDITVEQFGRSNMKDKFRSRVLSGSGAPAVATMESVDAAAWVDTGGLREIGDWIDDAGIRDEFVSGKWGPLTKDGGTYALPWDVGPVAAFYRNDVADEHGLDMDGIETWDEFIAEGEKLPDDVAMLNLPPNDYDGVWRMMFRQLGGLPFTDSGAVNINSEKSLRVARQMKEAHDAGITSSVASWSSEWFSRASEGTITTILSGAWLEGTLKSEVGDTAGKWRVMRPPAYESGGNRATNWGGSNLIIADQVSEAKARRGWDYMQFALGTKEQQVTMYEEYGLFPAYKPAYESDVFDQGSEFLGGQAAGRLFAEIAPNIPTYKYTTDTPEITKAINSEFDRMINGQISPKEAVDTAAQQVADRTGRDLA